MPYKPKTHSQRLKRKRVPDTRPSASRRGYDDRWRRIRSIYLAHNPLCAHCLRDSCGKHMVVATEVDHRTRLSRGGTHDWHNLQSLCKSCHSKKTRAEESEADDAIT